MDEALKLKQYLPIFYKNIPEGEYIEFLWEAFRINYDEQKYQFAFFAYHMLIMSFVYFNVWQIKQLKSEDFKKEFGRLKRKMKKRDAFTASSPFAFRAESERVVFNFLELANCDRNKIDSYIRLVDDRNEVAHANGYIVYKTKEALDARIAEALKVVEDIQNHLNPIIERAFSTFLCNSCGPEEPAYLDTADQFNEKLIRENYFSYKDVDVCLAFDITTLDRHSNTVSINKLFLDFQNLSLPKIVD